MPKFRPVTTVLAAGSRGDRAIRLAPLTCPYCQHGLRAADIESLDADAFRLICPACYRDLFTIERP